MTADAHAREDRHRADDRHPSEVAWRLAAFAFADVVDFSRWMASDDVKALTLWNRMQTELLVPAMERYRGRLAKKIGDAVLVEFPSVVHAVNWAIEVQRAARGGAVSDEAGAPMLLRIGINVDDAIDDDGTLFSNGVNIAARIHQAAAPGEVVLTRIARELVADRAAAGFREIGEQRLKNIDTPVHLYAIALDAPARVRTLAVPHLQWHARPTLAVLPFRDRAGREEDRYFAEGLTEEIITGVSRSRALFVVSHSSTLAYRDDDRDPRTIGAALQVKYVLTGSVRRQADRLRIHVELVQVDGGHAVWSDRYAGKPTDLFAFQDEIAASIVGALGPKVRAAERALICHRPTESLDAYDCVLRAVTALYRFSRDSYSEARGLLERAIALDPEYAQAHAHLAWCLNFWIGEGHTQTPAEDTRTAIAAAQRARELDPDDAFTLAVAGHITSFQEGDPVAGLELLEQAVSLDENASIAWALGAAAHAYLGHGEEARERLRNVWRLSPFDELNFFYWTIAGIGEFVAGRYEQSIYWLRRSLRANPRLVATLRVLAASSALAGDEDAAKETAQRLLEIEPGFRVSGFMAKYPLKRKFDRTRLEEGLIAANLPR